MAERLIVHGLIQKARLDASRYQILPGSDWGYVIWRQPIDCPWMWTAIAKRPCIGSAQEFACKELAELAE